MTKTSLLSRQPKPGELLFEFYVERDHARWLCELRDHGDVYGIEAAFYRNEEFSSSRRFDRTMSLETTTFRPLVRLASFFTDHHLSALAVEMGNQDAAMAALAEFKRATLEIGAVHGVDASGHFVALVGDHVEVRRQNV